MEKRPIRVRFAPIKTTSAGRDQVSEVSHTSFSPESGNTGNKQIIARKNRSRKGCQECRQRRVKCDESFPVCRRCQQRGLVCQSEPPMHGWQLELPWIFAAMSDPSQAISKANSPLLQWWFDKTSHIMVLNPQANPLSYPILEHLAASPSLLHTIQGISSAHQAYFEDNKLATCLHERSLALNLVQAELSRNETPLAALFLSVFMLGISTPWMDDSCQDFGKEHLFGARAILDQILSRRESWNDPNVKIMVGYYLFWDMSVALLPESNLLPKLDTPEIQGIVEEMRDFFHPIGGYSVKMFYLISILGRYFWSVVKSGQRDLVLEFETEDTLLTWRHSETDPYISVLCDSFRRQGLVLLGQIKMQALIPDYDVEEDILQQIQENSRKAVRGLLSTPVSQHCFNAQAIPLAFAASELTAEDENERAETVARLKAIFSLSRTRTVLSAVDLLEQLWRVRDSGVKVTYHELMLWKNWRLSLV